MNPDSASRTAIGAALMRGLHTRADAHRILDDAWADRLVPSSARELLYDLVRRIDGASPGAAADAAARQAAVDALLRGNAAYANVILRSRYAEDALHRALARGVRQYVLVGAGFDSYALRRPPEAADLTVIEIDHPATQSLKRQRVTACGAPWPASARFIAADLAAEDLPSVLRRSGLRLSEPVFFSWLGVTMYLSRGANMATLRAIASTAVPGSELVFSYIEQALLDALSSDADVHSATALHKIVAAAGEPFVCGFDPATLGHELQALGYRVLEDCSEVDLLRRYDPSDRNGFAARETSRVAHVRVD